MQQMRCDSYYFLSHLFFEYFIMVYSFSFGTRFTNPFFVQNPFVISSGASYTYSLIQTYSVATVHFIEKTGGYYESQVNEQKQI